MIVLVCLHHNVSDEQVLEFNSLKLHKMHCFGNDVLIVFEEKYIPIEVWQLLAHRRLGVGCDQVIHIKLLDHDRRLIQLAIINQDGSTAQQCLNGALCLGLLLKNKYPEISRWTTETEHCQNEIEVNEEVFVSSTAFFEMPPGNHKNFSGPQSWLHQDLVFPWFFCNVGNPHAIILTESGPFTLSSLTFEEHCKRFLSEHYFPQGVNVSFLNIRADNHFNIRTFERGAGETLACGSAAMAAAAVASRFFVAPQSVQVHNLVGFYKVDIALPKVSLAGQPQIVFETTMTVDAVEQGLLLYRSLR